MVIANVSAGDMATSAKINEIIAAVNTVITDVDVIEEDATGSPTFSLANGSNDDGLTFRCWVQVTITRAAPVGGYVIQYKEASDSVYFIIHVAQPEAGNPVVSTPYLEENTLYDFRAAYVSQIGEIGDWSAVQQITTDASTHVLSAPTGLAATAIQGGVILTWTDLGLLGESYNIYVNTVDTYATSTLAGTIIGTVFVWWVETPASEYVAHYFWVTTVSKSGVESAPTSSVTTTPAQAVSEDLATASVIEAKIGAGAVVTAALANLCVETGKLANLAVDVTKLGSDAVIAEKIAAGAVVADKIAANAVVADKIAANAVITDKIDANAVTSAKIAANTIVAADIAAATITATELATGCITTEKLDALAVTAAKIAANTITAGQIAANAVSTDELNALSVTAAKIAANTITAAKIAADTITATEMSAAQATLDKIWAGTVTGKTFQTASSGVRAYINNAGIYINGQAINFQDTSSTVYGYMSGDSAGLNVISANAVPIRLNPASGIIHLLGNSYSYHMYPAGAAYDLGNAAGNYYRNLYLNTDAIVGGKVQTTGNVQINAAGVLHLYATANQFYFTPAGYNNYFWGHYPADSKSWFVYDITATAYRGYLTTAGTMYIDGTYETFSPHIADSAEDVVSQIRGEIDKPHAPRDASHNIVCPECGKKYGRGKGCCGDSGHTKIIEETYGKDVGLVSLASGKLVTMLYDKIQQLEDRIDELEKAAMA